MPGPQDLLAMLGGGGGGGMPPGGGGMPPGGGAIQQVLQQLMQDPAAMQGMMNFMQGQPPTAGMPQPMGLPPGAGGAPPPPVGGGMPPNMPPGGVPEGMPPEEGGDAEQMASDQIDQAGNTWDGVDAPTKNDIQRLKEDPNEEAIASFNEQFGEGAAERYLGEDGGEGEEEDPTQEEDKSSDDDDDY